LTGIEAEERVGCWGGTIDVFTLPSREAPTMPSPNVATILRDHVSLSTSCIDRLYLNGYVPKLQSSGQLCAFLCDHLGNRIASPAALRPLHDRFVQDVTAFAEQQLVPIVQFERGQRKDDVAAPHRRRFQATEGVVFIGVSQERQFSFKATKHIVPPHAVHFSFTRQSVAVKHYYFYLQDAEWGPAFIKVGTYVPYPARVCLNGNEWLKQQLRKEAIPFDSLDNGFRWCADPDRLQQVADSLSPADVQGFFDRWLEWLPWPLTPADRAAGYLGKTLDNIMSSAFGNAGERCLAGSVVVAVGSKADHLVDALRERAASLKVGPGSNPRSELTPLIRESHRENVKKYVDLGEQEGAEVVLDGRTPPRPEGFYLGPTLLDRTNGEMRVAREEIFGPVLSIVRARTLDEAIAFTNGSNFGNACSIFTDSGAAARHFREHIQAGMLGINIGVAGPMAFFPFNGIKGSFFGDLHAMGKDGVRFSPRTRWRRCAGFHAPNLRRWMR